MYINYKDGVSYTHILYIQHTLKNIAALITYMSWQSVLFLKSCL